MNKFKLKISGDEQYLNIPLEIRWDFGGRDDSIDEYQQTVVEEIIGEPDDYEVFRFAHDVYGLDNDTEIKYEFNFYSGNTTNINTSTDIDWVTSYQSGGFSYDDLYYKLKPFAKSFFKLDFYDTKDFTTQTNYMTVILPVGNSSIDSNDKFINVPTFTLNYLKNKEGFFWYWLRDKTLLNLDTFYMTAKFFDANNGVFVKMMTRPQSTLPSKFQFNNDLFYVKTKLDYNTKTYKLYDLITNKRIGDGQTIKWYEYINP